MVGTHRFKPIYLIRLVMAAAICSLCCTVGCTTSSASPPLSDIRFDAELTWFTPENSQITSTRVEIADTRDAQLQGLKGRRLAGDGEGMLFVYTDSVFRTFIMTDTPGALDILFADEAGRIITIHEHTRPLSNTTYTSSAPAMFVVEVPAGFCRRQGIRKGTTIRYRRR